MKLKYKILLAIITVGIGICLMAYQSYALWVASYTGGENIVEVGCFSVEFEELSSSVELHNTYPVSDQKGLLLTPYTFKITNTCTNDAAYNVTLNTLTTNTMQKNWLKYAIYKSTESKPATGTNLGTVSNFNIVTEELQITNLDESIIIASGNLKQNESETYNFYLWMDEATGNEAMNTKFEGSINIISSATKLLSATETILTKGETEELKFDNTVDNNLRYVGANPNNYVSFNNELWRIIGVFNNIDDGTGKKETRLKIIRDEPIGEYSWDNKGVYGENDWTNSAIQQVLNEGAYWNRTTGECPYGNNGATKACDFSTNGLTEEAKEMIGNTLWNLGGTASIITALASDYYMYERGTDVYNEHATEWIGKIGLMYPSDYGYATSGGSKTNREICLNNELSSWNYSSLNDCKNNDWIYKNSYIQWMIMPRSSDSIGMIFVNTKGMVIFASSCSGYRSLSPALYLRSNVKISGGEGTSDNPYILSL